MKPEWKSDNFLSPISGDSLKSMKQNDIIVIHSKKHSKFYIFSSCVSNFLQLSVNLLVCGYYGAFQALRTAFYVSENFSYPSGNELAIEIYWAIVLKMSLSPGNKCDNSFNSYLQKSIARWEPSFRVVVCSFHSKIMKLYKKVFQQKSRSLSRVFCECTVEIKLWKTPSRVT